MAVVEGTVTITTPAAVCNPDRRPYDLVDCETGKRVAVLKPGITEINMVGEFCVHYRVVDCCDDPEVPEFPTYPLAPSGEIGEILACLSEIKELMANPVGIEVGFAKVGCALDANGVAIGSVLLCKTVDEATGEETLVPKAYLYDGTVIDDYAGEWGECLEPVVIEENFCVDSE